MTVKEWLVELDSWLDEAVPDHRMAWVQDLYDNETHHLDALLEVDDALKHKSRP
jgi:hypothetical protein